MSIKIALAGNPNSGKTTLFNSLTGLNQFVGNWPGVTVEKKEGALKGQPDVTVTDLPGIYSLSPYSPEEVVARNYLVNERPDAILNIVDGTNLERNLYLTTQLAEIGIPVVMAVNMMDIVDKSGNKFDFDMLAKVTGTTVVPISALKEDGVSEAAKKAVEAAKEGKAGTACRFDGRLEAMLLEIESRLGDDVPQNARRYYAVKLFEKDTKLDIDAPDVSDIIAEAEKVFDDDSESIIINARYEYITSAIKSCFKKRTEETLTVSDKIDRIVTNRFLALPIFAAIMIIVYYVSISTVGTMFTDWVNDGLFGEGYHLFAVGESEYNDAMSDYAEEHLWTNDVVATVESAAENGVIGADDILSAIENKDYGAFDKAYGFYSDSLSEEGFDISQRIDKAMEAHASPEPSDYGWWLKSIPAAVEAGLEYLGTSEWLNGLILDGIVGGVGAVLGFLPQMFVLFIFLAFLEGCGYMARIAFIMDRLFRKFGLSGKSFIPMLVGTGCGVPGIMASRTIESDRDRKMTIMTTTFIPCSAKIPIIALIAAALFHNAWWVAPSAYFVGIAAIVCSGMLLKKTKMFAGDVSPFVMELPAYHMPTVRNVLRNMWERGRSFIKKAGTIILLSSVLIWAGSVFGITDGAFGFNADMELENSILGIIGGAVKWIFTPLGFGNIKAAVATIMGLVAKEEVVGVFGVLDFEGLSRLSAYSFLLFNLLCAPCFAAIGAIRREMNSAKWTWFAIGYQCVFAYFVSLCVYQIGIFAVTGSFGLGTAAAILLAICFIYLLARPQKRVTSLKEVR